MAPFIFGELTGSIINPKTLPLYNDAAGRKVAGRGRGKILFVGTKRSAREAARRRPRVAACRT
jgi:ribosomal protein S2